jgi:hypothetical protein
LVEKLVQKGTTTTAGGSGVMFCFFCPSMLMLRLMLMSQTAADGSGTGARDVL